MHPRLAAARCRWTFKSRGCCSKTSRTLNCASARVASVQGTLSRRRCARCCAAPRRVPPSPLIAVVRALITTPPLYAPADLQNTGTSPIARRAALDGPRACKLRYGPSKRASSRKTSVNVSSSPGCACGERWSKAGVNSLARLLLVNIPMEPDMHWQRAEPPRPTPPSRHGAMHALTDRHSTP